MNGKIKSIVINALDNIYTDIDAIQKILFWVLLKVEGLEFFNYNLGFAQTENILAD